MPKDNLLSSHRNRAGKFFLLCTALGVCLGPASLSFAEPASTALPTGGSVVSGSAVISSSGSQMNVNQSSDKTIINWNSFDIGSDAGVTFVQPDASSVALNRVTSSDVSEIYGSLSANGKLVLINPNGVIFGSGSSVDAASMVASTMSLSNEDFLAGNYAFFLDGATGSIENNGSISASGGFVALLGASVSNSGTINAPSGKVVLAAGESLELPLTASGLISLEIGEADIETSITNNGIITAPNGQVYISAQSAADIASSVVNKGAITAKDVTVDSSSSLFLDGGSNVTAQSATLTADTITGSGDVSADTLSLTGGYISLAGSFTGRDITLSGTEAVLLSSASSITADAANGGTIKITSPYGTVLVSGTVSAQGLSGTGGTILISGVYKTVLLGADINAGGTAGGGIVYVGGGWQGDTSLIDAAATLTVDSSSTIAADATDNGTGGEIVFFSTDTTSFYGNATARGGVNGGNGGKIELSGDTLNVQISETNGLNVLARASGYANGSILIDPANLVIGDVSSSYNIFLDITESFSSNNITTAEAQRIGTSVALSDTYALIGATGANGGAGTAYLYNLSTGEWLDLSTAFGTTVTLSGAAAFGISVALNNSYALIGAYYDYSDVNSPVKTGMAYLYKISDGTWTVLDGYTSGAVNSALFGYAVALSDSYALIGAYQDYSDASSSSWTGMAYLYKISDGTWTILDGYTFGGTAAMTRFGYAVALNDSYALIGASNDYSDASPSTRTGMAYLYKIADGTWAVLDGYEAGATVASAYFGGAVALNDTYALIGAYYDYSDASPSTRTGMAYLYKIADSTWTVLDAVSFGVTTSSASFGYTVALNNTYALIGAKSIPSVYLYKFSDGSREEISSVKASSVALNETKALIGYASDRGTYGTAFLYDLSSKTLENVALMENSPFYISGSLLTENSVFATSVALSDSFALISAYGAGTAYLYNLATEEWLDLSTTSGAPSFSGNTVAISGDYALIGDSDAYSNVSPLTQTGMAYLYRISDGAWTILDGYSAGVSTTAYFGSALALNDSYALIGAHTDLSDASSSTQTGMAYLYKISDGTWTVLDGYSAGATTNAHFGFSVALSNTYALIGAYFDYSDASSSTKTGMAYLYKLSDGSWTSLDGYTAGAASFANFGYSAALSDTYVLIGADNDYSDASSSTRTGMAYLYKIADGTWTVLDGYSAGATISSAHFGYSVALNDTYALIGAYYDYSDASPSIRTGMAYLYKIADSTWTVLDAVNFGATTASAYFGRSVALTDTNILVAASKANGGIGAVYLTEIRNFSPDLTTSDIQTLLASGNVTLTADNSITILDLSLTSADSGNSLTLISGGSIEAAGTITFGGREVTLVGNAASSLLDNAALREAGAGGINVASTSSIDNSGGTILFQIGTSDDSERTGSYALAGDFVIAGSVLADGIIFDGAESALTLSASLTEAGGDIVINTYETTLTGSAAFTLGAGNWFVYNSRTDAQGTVDLASYTADFTQISCAYGSCTPSGSGNGLFYAYPPASSGGSDTQATEDNIAALQRSIIPSLTRALPQVASNTKSGIFAVKTSALSGGNNLFGTSTNNAGSYLMLLSSIMEEGDVDLLNLLKEDYPDLKALKKVKGWQGASLPEGLIFNPEKGFLEGLRGSDVYNLDIVGTSSTGQEHTVSVSLIPRG